MRKLMILVLFGVLLCGNTVFAHQKRHMHYKPPIHHRYVSPHYPHYINSYYHRFNCPARRGFRCTCFRRGGVYIDLRLPIVF